VKAILLILALGLHFPLAANPVPRINAWDYSQAQRSGNRFYAWSCAALGAAVVGLTAAQLSRDPWWPRDKPWLTGAAASHAGIFGLGLGALVGRIGKDAILRARLQSASGPAGAGFHLALQF
jgi:hypothetical protein